MSAIKPLPTVEVGGVHIYANPLEREAARMSNLLQKLGKRLTYWFHQTRSGHVIPDEDTLASFSFYQRAMMEILREQRHRAEMKLLNQPLTEAEYALELERLRDELIDQAPPERLRAALEAKGK